MPGNQAGTLPGRSGQAQVILVLLVVLGLGALGFVVASNLSRTPATTTATDTNTGTNGGDTAPPVAPPLADNESFASLNAVYAEALGLGDRVGKARKDGTYGGTGFAYDVFNEKIGDKDRQIREGLLQECNDLLSAVQEGKARAEAVQVSDAYSGDKASILELYGLLERRAAILQQAASVAVDSPGEGSWRPILTPASTEARVAYQNAIAGAKPTQH